MNAFVVLSLLLSSPPVAPGNDDFRRAQPAPQAPSAFTVPQPTRFSAAGIEVFLVERHELPVVSATLSWRTGAVADRAEKAGLSSLCAAALNEGPARLDKVAFEEARADLAAALGVGAGTEQTTAFVRSLSTTFAPALGLLVETLATPGLRADDFARVQARSTAALLQQKGSAESIAGRLQDRVLWGRGHPFGAVPTEATLNAITVEDCRAFAARLGPQGARLFVVGDITRETLVRLLPQVAKAQRWKGSAPVASAVPAPRQRPGGVVAVDMPGATQSVVMILGEGPARTAKDFDAQGIAVSILGGGFSSRVNMNLREKHGYTYGARAGVSYTRTRGAFTMSSSVRTDVTGAAIREMVAELRGMQSGVVTDDELARERDGALQSFPARFATGAGVVDAWRVVDFYGLPRDTWEKTPARLLTIDKRAVAAAARTALPSSTTLFVVGDMSRIGADLQGISDDGLFGDGLALRRMDADGEDITATAPSTTSATPTAPRPTTAP
jgi:zinc protease